MKLYRVTGTARIGAGEVVGLADQQLAPRRHRVDVVQKGAAGARTTVRVKEMLEFMAGEEIELAAAPAMAAAELLVPADGSDDGLPRPKLEAAKVAKAKAAKAPRKVATA